MTDELDPRVAAALRDVRSASTEVRELHLTTALAQVRRPITVRSSARWLGVAAALVALLSGISAYTSSTSRPDSGVSAAEHSSSTMPAKSSVDSTTASGQPEAQMNCSSSLTGSVRVGDYVFGGGRRAVNLTDESMEIVDLSNCESILTFALPPLPRDQTVCIPSLRPDTQLVGPYASARSSVSVLATDSQVTIIGGPRCEEIARVDQPLNP